MEKVRPELIHIKFLEVQQKWTAFVTWDGMDLYELGFIKEQAIYYLCLRHAKFLGLNGYNDIYGMLERVIEINNVRM